MSLSDAFKGLIGEVVVLSTLGNVFGETLLVLTESSPLAILFSFTGFVFCFFEGGSVSFLFAVTVLFPYAPASLVLCSCCTEDIPCATTADVAGAAFVVETVELVLVALSDSETCSIVLLVVLHLASTVSIVVLFSFDSGFVPTSPDDDDDEHIFSFS